MRTLGLRFRPRSPLAPESQDPAVAGGHEERSQQPGFAGRLAARLLGERQLGFARGTHGRRRHATAQGPGHR